MDGDRKGDMWGLHCGHILVLHSGVCSLEPTTKGDRRWCEWLSTLLVDALRASASRSKFLLSAVTMRSKAWSVLCEGRMGGALASQGPQAVFLPSVPTGRDSTTRPRPA